MPYCDHFLLRGEKTKQNKKNSTKCLKLGKKIHNVCFFSWHFVLTVKEVVRILKFIYVKTNLNICSVDVGCCAQNTWEVKTSWNESIQILVPSQFLLLDK